jgi:hypothetical protein
MGYSSDSSMVRVDFFKPSGKWYCTEAVKWTGEYKGDRGQSIHEALAQSLRDHFIKGSNPTRLSEMDAICLHPYHEYEHPIQIKNGRWLNEDKFPSSH